MSLIVDTLKHLYFSLIINALKKSFLSSVYRLRKWVQGENERSSSKKKSVTSLLNSLSVTLEKKLSTEKLPFEATFFEATFSTEIDIFWHPKSQSRSTLWAPFGDQSWRGCLSKGTVLEKRYIEFSQSFLILELTPNDFVIIRAFLSFESIVMLLKKIVKRPWLFYAKISGRNIIQKHEYLTWNARFRRKEN